MTDSSAGKQAAAQAALRFVDDDAVIGVDEEVDRGAGADADDRVVRDEPERGLRRRLLPCRGVRHVRFPRVFQTFQRP